MESYTLSNLKLALSDNLPLNAEWYYYTDERDGQVIIKTGCRIDDNKNLQMIDPDLLYEDYDE